MLLKYLTFDLMIIDELFYLLFVLSIFLTLDNVITACLFILKHN